MPPAWADVWICRTADGHLQATGRDDAGRKQHLYHPDFRALADRLKFERLAHFGRALRSIRPAVHRAVVDGDDEEERAVALAVGIVDAGLLRVGNEESARAGHHGVSTLAHDDIDHDGGTLLIDFTGKSGQRQTARIEDRDLCAAIDQLDDDHERLLEVEVTRAGRRQLPVRVRR